MRTSVITRLILAATFTLIFFSQALASDQVRAKAVEKAKNEFLASIAGDFGVLEEGESTCATACAYAFAEVSVECFAYACVECETEMICSYSESSAWAYSEASVCVEACIVEEEEVCEEEAVVVAAAKEKETMPFFNLMRVFSMPNTSSKLSVNNTGSTVNFVRYGLWNKFIQLANIYEIVNPSDVAIDVTLKVGDAVKNVNIAANSQGDFLIDSMFDLKENTYGIIEAKSNRVFHSRVVQYRPGPGGFSDLQAAASSEVVPALRGESSVLTNTFDPSGRGVQVSAWLTLVNLSDSAKKFLVSAYDQDGKFKSVRELTIAAFTRADVEGGHESLGANQVAQLVITPEDKDSGYLATLARFGLDGNKYIFASTTPARVGSSDTAYVSVAHSTSNLTDWLEIANPTDSSAVYSVKIDAQSGQNRFNQNITLPARSQLHLGVHEYLLAGEFGLATISSASKSLVSSMFYDYNSDTKTVVAYNSLARSVIDKTLYSSANFFLGHDNKLLVSALEGTTNFKINVAGVDSRIFTVPSNGSMLLDLSDTANFSTSSDTYSIVKISADKKIYSEVYRELDKRYVVPVPSLLYGGNASDTQESPQELVNRQFIHEYAQARSKEVADLIRAEIAKGRTLDSKQVQEMKKDYASFPMLSNMLNVKAAADAPAEEVPETCVTACAWAWAHAEAYCYASAWAYCPSTGAFAYGFGYAFANASGWGFACATACAAEGGDACEDDEDDACIVAFDGTSSCSSSSLSSASRSSLSSSSSSDRSSSSSSSNSSSSSSSSAS